MYVVGIDTCMLCKAGARSGWRKKGMFELTAKYCQAYIMQYVCVETNN